MRTTCMVEPPPTWSEHLRSPRPAPLWLDLRNPITNPPAPELITDGPAEFDDRELAYRLPIPAEVGSLAPYKSPVLRCSCCGSTRPARNAIQICDRCAETAATQPEPREEKPNV